MRRTFRNALKVLLKVLKELYSTHFQQFPALQQTAESRDTACIDYFLVFVVVFNTAFFAARLLLIQK